MLWFQVQILVGPPLLPKDPAEVHLRYIAALAVHTGGTLGDPRKDRSQQVESRRPQDWMAYDIEDLSHEARRRRLGSPHGG